jgi:hypothetical protein
MTPLTSWHGVCDRCQHLRYAETCQQLQLALHLISKGHLLAECTQLKLTCNLGALAYLVRYIFHLRQACSHRHVAGNWAQTHPGPATCARRGLHGQSSYCTHLHTWDTVTVVLLVSPSRSWRYSKATLERTNYSLSPLESSKCFRNVRTFGCTGMQRSWHASWLLHPPPKRHRLLKGNQPLSSRAAAEAAVTELAAAAARAAVTDDVRCPPHPLRSATRCLISRHHSWQAARDQRGHQQPGCQP